MAEKIGAVGSRCRVTGVVAPEGCIVQRGGWSAKVLGVFAR